MNGLGARASERICGFGHDDFRYKLKLLEGVSPPPSPPPSQPVGECQGAKDRERESAYARGRWIQSAILEVTGIPDKDGKKQRDRGERATD